jgi:uncharacterized metal-binding protein YceD (DUF177 family)
MISKPQPEFHRPVDVGRLEDGDYRVEQISATAEEREALARRFALDSLGRLDAKVDLLRRGRQIVAMAHMEADVVQACVVSLEPIAASLAVDFVQLYDPDVRENGEFDELLDVDDDDPPEPLVDEQVDIGELVAERFGLALDPYPRKPGASIDPRYLAEPEPESRTNPFDVLKSLKR